ncbi:Ketosteroid isomerase-related protein [Pseudomonas sp. 8AS]|uniref:nuclear transport factor 2 family protein n=1 Tax=Pseudomonas sp. 8AS TaxID=2653163 RepID=UPI0012EFE789|nr:nuclear transport factor 2 family protein [Pseudomonas sp. 8AS]VXB34750.1 Ketosteroid isomerase-related protein [Pseudomonas sp. 8AS]
MAHPNAELISRFYQAFQQLDAEAMVACYAEDVQFSDPAFTDLRGRDAGDMWRMLAARAQNFSLTFDSVQADDRQGSARWVATYLFSKTGNTVVNHIQANFRFEDGKIVEHRDSFDLWRWARQALGTQGLLLGWTPLVQGAIRKQAMAGLRAWQASRRVT